MSLVKRSLSIAGHRTSLALEAEFWAVIDAHIANGPHSFAGFIRAMDTARIESGAPQNLASYLRVWCLKQVQGPKL